MNTDVNLRRLPDIQRYNSKFLVPLASFMWNPHRTDSTHKFMKATERQFISNKNMHLRTAGIPTLIIQNILSILIFQKVMFYLFPLRDCGLKPLLCRLQLPDRHRQDPDVRHHRKHKSSDHQQWMLRLHRQRLLHVWYG